MNAETKDLQESEEQILYAKVLASGMYLGLGILLVTFFLYVFGIIPPAVPCDALGNYWSLDVHHYLEAVENNHLQLGHVVTGWSWVKLLGKGDYLNFLGIAILSLITILCFMSIIPTLIRKGDKVYAVVAFIEVLILSLAASGILTAGH